MAGPEETITDPPQSVRPALLTYKKKKPLVLSPPPPSTRPILSKNRDKFDLSLCNSCGFNFQNLDSTNKSNSICILKSEWRFLLLCTTCFARIKSGDFCSYCLQTEPDDVANVDADALKFLQCIKCSCRVHRCCLPREHRNDFTTWCNLGSFICVDCLQVPNSFHRNKNGVGLELVCREIDTDVAIRVLSEKDDDMDMAIKVHLEMNGSHRFSKRMVNSGRLIEPCKVKKGKSRISSSISGNNRGFNEKFTRITNGFYSVVLALECVQSKSAPLSNFKDKILIKDLIKIEQIENQEKKEDNNNRFSKTYKRKLINTGTVNSIVGTVNGHDRYGNKYQRRKELKTETGTRNEGGNNSNEIQLKTQLSKQDLTERYDKGRDRYEIKYQRRK